MQMPEHICENSEGFKGSIAMPCIGASVALMEKWRTLAPSRNQQRDSEERKESVLASVVRFTFRRH